jgi:catechol 2,3-dioxygenase-like lactoylglutathione lyase family enzyme
VSAWRARLACLVLSAPDPRAAASAWAAVLGGQARGDEVLLDAGTRLVVERGAPALRQMRYEADGGVLEAAGAPGSVADLRDADGWPVSLSVVDAPTRTAPAGPMLGHVTLCSPDPDRAAATYEFLGFSLSDALGDLFRWLRCNDVHHSVAFTRGAAGVHHLAVEYPDRASFVDAIDRVAAAGLRVEFGPGRHMVGGNLFAYFRDAHGLRWELFCEIERIGPEGRPLPRLGDEDRARSVNVWGPQPPASFVREAGGPAPAAA